MNRALILACLMTIFAGGTSAQAFKKCPVNEFDGSAVTQAIEQAPTCRASFDILDICRMGASGDVPRAVVVIEKCEEVFLANLKPDRKRAYDAARQDCRRKYDKREGTMYVSAAAICEAQAAVRFAR
jgi:hypothetical protein